MTDEMMSLRALIGKAPDADPPSEMTDFAAWRLMELGAGEPTGAAHGEKGAGRLARRNGYRDRNWETRAGTVGLRIAELRKGPHLPGFLEPRRVAEVASTAAIQGAQVQGVPTRSADDPVKATGMGGIPKGRVSRPCEGIDGEGRAFLKPPIEGVRPHLWLD